MSNKSKKNRAQSGSTLTTVGYGDMYPITSPGQFFGGIISIIGIALFALPTGILASGFSTHIEKLKGKNKSDQSCPHCGESLTQ
ncbi:two pore domain potassium channel family protein [Crocinitomix catalasitica]|nr:two pore domain potassium channel family protein [Crocinitomix catalasitica]